MATCTAFIYTHEVADFMMHIHVASEHITLPELDEFQDLLSPLQTPQRNQTPQGNTPVDTNTSISVNTTPGV